MLYFIIIRNANGATLGFNMRAKEKLEFQNKNF